VRLRFQTLNQSLKGCAGFYFTGRHGVGSLTQCPHLEGVRKRHGKMKACVLR
jgi:hypothetical protein